MDKAGAGAASAVGCRRGWSLGRRNTHTQTGGGYAVLPILRVCVIDWAAAR